MLPSLYPHTTLPKIRVFPPQTRRDGFGAILTHRTQNTSYPFRFRTPAICTTWADFVRRACCHVSAYGTFCLQNDTSFLSSENHQLDEKTAFSAHFHLVRLQTPPLPAEKNRKICGEKKCFLSRMKNFLLHKKREIEGKRALNPSFFTFGNGFTVPLTPVLA